MKYKKLLILFIIIVFSKHTFCQSESLPFYNKVQNGVNSLNSFLKQSFLDSYTKSSIKICGNGCMFIIFNIDSKGNVTEVKSDSSNSFLDSTIKKILISTNGQWTPAKKNKKSIMSKALLIPIIYNFGTCTTIFPSKFEEILNHLPTIDTNSIKSNTLHNKIHKTPDYFWDLLKVNKIWGYSFIDCTFLSPLYIDYVIVI